MNVALENKLGINESSKLAREEERISKINAVKLWDNGLLEKMDVGTFASLSFINEYLFGEIYEFAGKIRTVNIAKNDFRFAPVMYLEEAIKNIEKMPQSNFDEIIELFDKGIIDVAQLHGSEDEDYIIGLKEKTDKKLRIINAIEMSEDVDLDGYVDTQADFLLLDSGKGSGKTFDWRLIRKNLKKEFFLAGGLDISNIRQAIEEFKPYAVDLSSSLETDGYKDENKIKEIMEVIR